MKALQMQRVSLLTNQGELTLFMGQKPIFISSKQRKCLLEGWHQVTGQGAVGWVTGWTLLPNLESGSLLVVIRGAFGRLQRGFRQFQRGPYFWALLIWSWGRTQQGALFLLSTLNSLGACGRSASAAAHDLILVEAGGKGPWQVPICS